MTLVCSKPSENVFVSTYVQAPSLLQQAMKWHHCSRLTIHSINNRAKWGEVITFSLWQMPSLDFSWDNGTNASKVWASYLIITAAFWESTSRSCWATMSLLRKSCILLSLLLWYSFKESLSSWKVFSNWNNKYSISKIGSELDSAGCGSSAHS